MKYFDSHAHIGLIFDDPIEQLIVCQQAKASGVDKIVSICNSLIDFLQVYENLKTASHVYHAIGVSPSEVQNPGKDWRQKIDENVKKPRVIAIGEIGLDYFHKFGDKRSQIELFIEQLELANRYNLPVIIHNREAGKDVLDILKDKLPAAGGVLHCYSEDADYAKRALDYNLYISFAGNLTYRNARNLHDTALVVPIDRILVESESPFMVPAEFRGKRNKPEYLPSTVKFLADHLRYDVTQLAEQLYANSLSFFRISE